MTQPRKIADVMAQLMARKGYARQQSTVALEEVWRQAAGKQLAEVTRAGNVQRGTLEVFVANNLLAQELGFRRDELIKRLQQLAPKERITTLRFRIGPVT